MHIPSSASFIEDTFPGLREPDAKLCYRCKKAPRDDRNYCVPCRRIMQTESRRSLQLSKMADVYRPKKG